MGRATEYDYVIAGGGAAGSVLAARLSEDPGVRVALIEAGPDLRPDTAPGALRSVNVFEAIEGDALRAYAWDGLTARRGPGQEPAFLLRGRGLGGSTAMNGAIAAQPLPEDFAAWTAAGCDGWSWEEVLPARRRVEDDLDFGDRPHHGRDGPLPISRTPREQWRATSRALHAAAMDLGYGEAEDLNDPWATGVAPAPHACRAGRRISAAEAYLEPVRDRPNLTIACDRLVDRVLVSAGAAIGVSALGPDGVQERFHGGQTIVSAGATATPGVLVRSGIGPEATLAALDIATLADLPVGQSYQDHAGVGLTIRLRPQECEWRSDTHPMPCVLRYSSSLGGGGRSDMAVLCLDATGGTQKSAATGYLKVCVYAPFSRGSVRVVSRDPRAHPVIEMCLLDDERDRVRLRDGVRRLAELVRRPAFGGVAEEISTATSTVHQQSGGGAFTLDRVDDDRALDAFLSATVGDSIHGVGTCPMGPPGDSRRVVDSACRVVGVGALRVIDASVMPTIPRANTQLPTMVLAEHMAGRLRDERSTTTPGSDR